MGVLVSVWCPSFRPLVSVLLVSVLVSGCPSFRPSFRVS
jgi:hypothetical protein